MPSFFVWERKSDWLENGARRIEYALQLDCELNGCEAKFGFKHADDGEILGIRAQEDWLNTKTVNGHAVRHISRVITAGSWEDRPKKDRKPSGGKKYKAVG